MRLEFYWRTNRRLDGVMRNQSELKQALIDSLRSIWEDDGFALHDNERSNRLRAEILRRLLGLIMTDDERAADLGLPEGCRVREMAKIIAPEDLQCGKYVWIGENAIVDASGGLFIGDHTTVASSVFVWSHTSSLSNLMFENQSANAYIHRAPTHIGSGTFIGGPSVVYPGVSIGDRVLVLPMSVVTEDVPDNVVAAGAPARIIRKIDESWLSEEVSRLRRGRAWR
jgi:acetyltransferase-like isoleucine patch superfamily enzyme